MASEQEADRITQKYLRRWPDSKRAKSWAGRMVHIQTENGVWRTNGHGYTWAGKPDAWVLLFEEAQKCVAHCGPEKQATFIAARPAPAATDGGFASFCRFNVETYLLDTWLHMHHDRKPVSDEQVIEEVKHSIIQGRISLLKRHIERMEALLRAKEASKP